MGINLTDGFGHYYRPEPERERIAFDDGLIVLDTNVLLHVLRYSPTAREELLGVVEAIADRCFVPHQIALEYNRNRVSVVEDRRKELDSTAAEIDSIRGRVRGVVNNLRERRTLEADEVQKLEGAVSDFFSALDAAAADAADQYDLQPDNLVGRVDQWTSRLERALAQRVAEAPSPELVAEDEAEATRRREAGLAPGYKDKAGGDYLWWAEVMRHGPIAGRPLVVVTDDAAKGDWRHEVRGMTAGPHEILSEDVKKAGGTELVLLTTRDLLRLAGQTGTSQVSAETIAESEKALDSRHPGWTLTAYVQLIDSLAAEGYKDRSSVIRAAARHGGQLKREDVYRIAGLSEEEGRSLVRFATPVLRVTRDMVDSGVVPDGVAKALDADYDGPGKAIGYSVPSEFGEFEQLLTEAERIVERDATTDWEFRDQVQAQMRAAIKRLVLARTDTANATQVADALLGRVGATSVHNAAAANGRDEVR